MKYSVLLLLLTLTGCMTQPTVKSWLDPVSAVTITSQAEPLVLARITTLGKISTREFAQLAAIEVNRMGTRQLFLVVVPRSSADLTTKQRAAFENSFSELEIRADDRLLVLTRYAGEARELGVSESALPLSISGSEPRYYSIERADLRAMADSTRVELTASGLPGAPQIYAEWRDGRRSLSDFLSQLPGESSTSRQGDAP
jgi:hypothetical protein